MRTISKFQKKTNFDTSVKENQHFCLTLNGALLLSFRPADVLLEKKTLRYQVNLSTHNYC